MHNNASGVKLPGCGHCRVFGQRCSKACGQNVVLRLPYCAGSATRSLYTSRSLLPFTGFASGSGQACLRWRCRAGPKTRGLSPAMAAESIISSVRQWSGKLDDDLTVLVCDYIPTVGGGGFHSRC